MLCGTTVRWREKKTKMILANQYQLYRIPNNKSEMMASPFFFFLTFCYLFSTFKVFLIMLLFIFPVYSRAYPPHKAEQPLTNAGQIVISNGRLLLQANYISRNSETYLISYHKIFNIFSIFFLFFIRAFRCNRFQKSTFPLLFLTDCATQLSHTRKLRKNKTRETGR